MSKFNYIDAKDLPTQNYDARYERTTGWVYLCETPLGHKIGKSLDPKGRIKMLENEFECKIKVLHLIKFENKTYSYAEQAAHSIFHDKNNGNRLEFFNLTEEDIVLFKSKHFKDKLQNRIEKILAQKRMDVLKSITRDQKKIIKKIATMENKLKKLKKELQYRNRQTLSLSWHDSHNISKEDIANEILEYKKSLQ